MRPSASHVLAVVVLGTMVFSPSNSRIRALAAPAAAVQDASASGGVRADFNGDGYADLAIGAPHEDTPAGTESSGAVVVVYGSPDGLTGGTTSFPPPDFWSQGAEGVPGASEPSDFFGWALAAGDFNADGYSDLAVGVRGEDINTANGTVEDLGGVIVIYGSALGLKATEPRALPAKYFDLTESGVAITTSYALAGLGESLAAGDFDGDGDDDLAIGAPGFDTFGPRVLADHAGAVWVLRGSPVNGLGLAGNRLTSLADISYSWPEGSEVFGKALAVGDFNQDGFADLAVGAPGADTYEPDSWDGNVQPLSPGTRVLTDNGEVFLLRGSETGLRFAIGDSLRQGTTIAGDDSGADVAGVSETGDRFGESLASGDFNGDGFSDLAVGAPFEDLDGKRDVGAVNVLYGWAGGLTAAGNQFWSQDAIFGNRVTAYYGSRSEVSDWFGTALAAGDFDGNGRADLAIGVPLEDVVWDNGTVLLNVSDAGEVDVVYGSATGLSISGRAPQSFHQGVANIEGDPQAGDQFGRTLTAGNYGRNLALSKTDVRRFDDLAIGVPHEDVGGVQDAGAVAVIYGSSTALTWSRDQLWTQRSDGVPGGPEAADHFGWTVR